MRIALRVAFSGESLFEHLHVDELAAASKRERPFQYWFLIIRHAAETVPGAFSSGQVLVTFRPPDALAEVPSVMPRKLPKAARWND